MTRRCLLCRLLPAAGMCLSTPLFADEELDVYLRGDRIKISAPRLRFVAGPPLERLQNGAPVPFAIQLSISTDRWRSTLSRDIERFVLSYDLWEEKFSVIRLGNPRRGVSNLGARAAEAWCVDEMSLAAAGLKDQRFWVRLEVRNEDRSQSAGDAEGPTLAHLIELFSRRGRSDQQSRWQFDAGPLRLSDLRKMAAR
jgi:hypothetical protein